VGDGGRLDLPVVPDTVEVEGAVNDSTLVHVFAGTGQVLHDLHLLVELDLGVLFLDQMAQADAFLGIGEVVGHRADHARLEDPQQVGVIQVRHPLDHLEEGPGLLGMLLDVALDDAKLDLLVEGGLHRFVGDQILANLVEFLLDREFHSETYGTRALGIRRAGSSIESMEIRRVADCPGSLRTGREAERRCRTRPC
jgi:hypothetical protein